MVRFRNFVWVYVFLFSFTHLTNKFDLQASQQICEEETQIATNYEFIGYHMIASYMDCDLEALTNLEGLIQAMENGVSASGATLLQSVKHVFPPHGITMVMLLSESHASIHTYPEHKACFVDFFTCGHSCSSEKFDEMLRNYLQPKLVSHRLLLRQNDKDIDITFQKKN